ncbi:MAG TPA: FAD-binding oxidoreductase [Casimicrobiaceae bacterium]|nr:FAD-binding oxidoreductase [Casimicrobiaceae bacterium]
MERFDAIVIGGGVVGTSIACHLARFDAGRVLLVERGEVGGGTTAQSSCIVRTHYSVPENVAIAHAALEVFADFRRYLDDDDADCGLNRCGLMLVAPAGERAAALRATLAVQRSAGIEAQEIGTEAARRIHPLLDLSDDPVVGWEPGAGYADAYMTLSAYVRAARRHGALVREGVTVTGLVRDGARVTGVETTGGSIAAGIVVSAQNMWSREIERWTGIAVPLTLSRHAVVLFESRTPYTPDLPVVMDWVPRGGIYFRSYSGRQLMIGDTGDGEALAAPDTRQGEVPLDHVVQIGELLGRRVPAFADAGLAHSWTGVYDTTPDWNPVLGPLPGIDGLHVAFGFSGHGFKLSPVVGRLVAQSALGLPTDLPLAPYSIERFTTGRMLVGGYGASVVS